MGRGTSKAGGSTTTSTSSSSLPPVTRVLPPPTPQQVAQGNVMPAGGTPFSEFQSMSDDEKADVINDAINVGVPMFLDDSAVQRFAYFTGMSDKPNVVSDSALDKAQGASIYRTVNNAYNPRTDIGYTSKDICDQIAKGDFTMYSDSGGSAYGKAIYFAEGLSSSTAYKNASKNPKTMRAKITGGKGANYYNLSSQFSRDTSKLANTCRKADHNSQLALYALAKGYTHLSDGSGNGTYHMILNRSCLSVSSTYKDTNSLGGKWK